MALINIILGREDVIENFNSDVIPRVGESILTKEYGRDVVKDVIIDYRHIQYDNEEDRGSVFVWVFI